MKSDMFVEVWKDVKDYEGLYQVSNLGRVKNVITGKKLKLNKTKNGYLQVNLSKNNKAKHFYVHRLVTQVFLPNPDNLSDVNHKNECKWDNAVWNLEWCTRGYNCEYGERVNKEIITKQRKYGKPVLQYTLDGKFITEHPCLREAARQTGINRQNITACCKGKDWKGFNIKQAGGYIWKYKG